MTDPVSAIGPIAGFARFVAGLLGRGPYRPKKGLQARLIERATLMELPEDMPFRVIDADGKQYSGLYAIELMLLNCGNQAILSSDFAENAPLVIKVMEDVEISEFNIAYIGELNCCAERVSGNSIMVSFDFLNPGDYIKILIIVPSRPHVGVEVTGRFIGQEEPIDQTAEEVRASFGERMTNLIAMVLILNMVPGPLLAGWVIHHNYGWSIFMLGKSCESQVPTYLMGPFVAGVMIAIMLIMSRIAIWLERRAHPEGFLLHADLEPPLLENLKGMWRTVVYARKQRVSLSIFDWGRPVVFPGKKVRRRSVEDWIE